MSKLPKPFACLLLGSWLAGTTEGNLTTGGTVSADSVYNSSGTNPGLDNCVTNNNLVDGKWPSVGFSSFQHCCATTDPFTANHSYTWLNIDMHSRVVVETVMIINNEESLDYESRIKGSDLYVGDNSNPKLNTACGVYPQSSGVYLCGGKIGKYIGLYLPAKQYMNISQIRAYSYKPSAYPNYSIEHTELDAVWTTPVKSQSDLWTGRFVDDSVTTAAIFRPQFLITYYKILFDTERYIHVVTFVGNGFGTFYYSRYWKVDIGSSTGIYTTIGTYSLNSGFDDRGKEIVVGAYAKSLRVVNDGHFWVTFRWLGVFTTASNCQGAFDWSGSRASWSIPITTEAQQITGLFFAKIDDCAVFMSDLVLSDGSALPSYVSYDVYSHTMTVNVAAYQAPVTKTVKACANLNDRVTTAKSECQTKNVELTCVCATSVAWATSTFNQDAEQTGSQILFSMPGISFSPANALTLFSFALVNAPSFLTLQQSGSSAQGVISANPTTVIFNYQVTVTDSVSLLSSTLNASLIVYSCMPTSLTISPSSLTVRISGPSLSSTFSSAATYAACGTYTATVDPAFAYLVSISGSQISVQAPVTATTGVFNPVITLKRNNNPSQATTTEFIVLVLPPLMTSLYFSLTPPATSFYSEAEQTGAQVVFDFPAIAWAPLDADNFITFTLVGQPTFLTLTQSGTTAQGVISASATTGTFNYQVTVRDSVSSLSSTLSASLFVYSCMPTSFTISPSSQTVRISGPSLSSTFSSAATYLACGTYTATVDPAFAQLVSVSSSQIVVQAPVTATLGIFSPVITLKRENNLSQATTATLTVTVQPPLMTSLTFSLTPPATSFYSEAEQTATQVVFYFPAIAWAPLNADKVITFGLLGAPSFLTLTQLGTTAQGVISASATTGTFNYSVTVQDSVSSLSAVLDAVLLIQNCEPTGFTLTPSVVSISVLGKPQQISWSMNPNSKICGKYSVTVEQAYAPLLTVVEQQLVASAPKTTKIGSFSPLITLKRDSKPAQQVTSPLTLTVTNCEVTQLSFSKQPPSQIIVDLATYTEPITVPFDTKQEPLCENKVFFTLAPIQTFLSVMSSSITGGQIIVQDHQVTTVLFQMVQLRAFVDGQTAETSLLVIFSPKPAQKTEPNEDLPDGGATISSSDTAQTIYRTGWSPEEKKAVKQQLRQDLPLTGNPSPISMSGGFVFEFSMPLNLTSLENMDQWNNTNIGQDYFKFQLIPGDQKYFIENEEAYAYSWNITRITNTTIAFQIEFAQYMIVSQSQIDSMRFQILQPEAFVSQVNGKHIDFTSSLQRLPKQVKSIQEQKLIQSVESKLDRFLKTISAQSLLNIPLSQSLHLIWGMVSTQQIIVLTVLFNLKTPVSTQKIEIVILKMVSFDIFKMDTQLQRMFKFDLEASPPLNSRFFEANYETSNFLLNMGDMFLVEIIYVLLIGLVPLTRWLVDGQFPRIERYMKSFKLFNNFIRFYLESQMEICICTLLTFRHMNKQSWRQPQLWFANLYAAGNLCMLVIMPFILGYVALRYHKRYRIDRHYREQYDDIFGELRGDRKLPMLYFCFFTIRRYAIACSLIAMPGNYLFQIFLHVFSSLGFLIVLLFKKLHKDAKQAKKEIFDEMTILMTGYFLFLFTDFVSDADRNSQTGWGLVTLIFAHLVVNVSLILLDSFIAYKQKIRQIWLNYKLRKMRRQRLEEMEAVNQLLAEQGASQNQSELIREFEEPEPNQQISQRAQVQQEPSQSLEQREEQMLRVPSSVQENYSQQQPEDSESEFDERESESEESESESENSESESEQVQPEESKQLRSKDSESESEQVQPEESKQQRSKDSESESEQVQPEESKQQRSKDSKSESEQMQPEQSKQQHYQQRPQEIKIESDQVGQQKDSRKRFKPFTLQNDQIRKQNPLKSTKLFWPVPPEEIDPELYQIYGPSNLHTTMKKTEEGPQTEKLPIPKVTLFIGPEEIEREIRAFAKLSAASRKLSPSELKRR